jgi:pilin isopeptide linkage protein
MKLINRFSKVLVILLVLIMGLTIMAPAAHAVVAPEAPKIEIPVSVILSGEPPADDEDYEIVLEPDNPDYPMPEGSEDGVFTMIITGEDTGFLPEIAFSSLGVYTYTIQQTPGSNELATYDDSIYNLVVYVTNAEGGSGLVTTVNLYLLGETDKFEEVVFNNEYEAEDLPPLPETGEDPEERPPLPDTGTDPPEPTDRPRLPQTSDDTRIWPYVGLFISGAAMILLLGMTIKKRNMEE